MANRHAWSAWDRYLAAHQRHLDRFGHFIERDGIAPTVTGTAVEWRGTLHCSGGIEIHVRKLQEVEQRRRRMRVRTRLYSYHVIVRKGDAARSLFRYDNVHQHPGHQSAHHRHEHDETGRELHPAIHVGEDGWPTLADVLEEAERWFLAREGGLTPQ